MNIVALNDRELIEKFLMQHEDSSLFLLANLLEYGTRMGKHFNSGDYYGVYSGEELKGIFSLTKRGNLLVQDGGQPIDALGILNFLDENNTTTLVGCLGSPVTSRDLFKLLVKRGLQESYSSNEILYSISLENLSIEETRAQKISQKEFKCWMDLQICFARELGLETNLEESYYLNLFEQKLEGIGISGVVIDGELVSCAHLNAQFQSLCQVGGVYTREKDRRKGLSKDCMLNLMQNSKLFGLRKMILFTGEDNISAQRLYESLGFQRIGHYALYIGTPNS